MPVENFEDKFKNIQMDTLEALNRENRFLKKLLEANKLIGTTELRSTLKFILEAIVEMTNTRRGLIILCDKNFSPEQDLEGYHILIGTDEEMEEQESVTFCTGIAKKVMATGKMVVVDNVTENLEFQSRKSAVTLNLKGVLCFPLIVKKSILGVLYLDTNIQAHALTEKKAKLFEPLVEQVALAIENARLVDHLKTDNLLLKNELIGAFRFGNIVYASRKMENIIRLVTKVMDNPVSVLIYGESGTGKELIAQAIHYNSIRRDGHFIVQNCGALSESLLESELFGYKKGSFTGADADRVGLFEAADGGTIFLDEIGEISPNVQVKLLRVLESRSVRRIGETLERKIDIRVVAATNKNLEQMVREGKFREDLYFRLNVFPITVPPLRERIEDIPILVNQFMGLLNKELNKNITSLSRELLNHLMNRKWTGNIRELKNYLYRLMILCQGEELTIEDIPDEEKGLEDREEFSRLFTNKSLKTLAEMEKEYISFVLKNCANNKTLAAKKLDMNRSTLLFKMNKLGIPQAGHQG